MPCYHPVPAQQYVHPSTFKNTVKLIARDQAYKANLYLPCGLCIGCRLEQAKESALRCHHESTLHYENCFITLTYSNQEIPPYESLVHEHFQKFIRSLRKKTQEKIRYYMCGEYGEKTQRPHYHAILFGFDFPNKKLVNIRNGNRVYISDLLSEVWTRGTHEIGSVNFNSAGYVARYILKKHKGQRGLIAYSEQNRIPPYTRCSLKPGIGHDYYEKNKTDFFPRDYAVLPDGRQTSVPRYYQRLLERSDPALAEKLKKARIAKAKENFDNSPGRLRDREICKISQTNRLVRQL